MPENPKHDGPPPSTPEPNLKVALEMAQAGIPVLPMRVFWKGGKWLRGLEFSAVDKPGFWEQAGYHNIARVWPEERFEGQW